MPPQDGKAILLQYGPNFGMTAFSDPVDTRNMLGSALSAALKRPYPRRYLGYGKFSGCSEQQGYRLRHERRKVKLLHDHWWTVEQRDSMFKKILVANRRGNCPAHYVYLAGNGCGTVAVYSDVDQNAVHVLEAIRGRPFGHAEPAESYLNIDKIIRCCERRNRSRGNSSRLMISGRERGFC